MKFALTAVIAAIVSAAATYAYVDRTYTVLPRGAYVQAAVATKTFLDAMDKCAPKR